METYIQLTEAEWAFRITKDELAIRPIWHQKEDRVKAHILVCFLAYVLWKTLAGWMRNAGLVRANYRRTRREVFPLLSRIQNIGYEMGENGRSPAWYRANHRTPWVATMVDGTKYDLGSFGVAHRE